MNFLKRWKTSDMDGDLPSVESLLQRNLIPIFPRPDFVGDLRKNLLNKMPQEIEVTLSAQRKKLQTGLVVTGGILGGLLLILSGLRGIVSLVGVAALLINWLRHNSQQTPTVS